ncbi:MAG: hypothetical protein ACKOPH_05640, partial [Methylocystis sp.]
GLGFFGFACARLIAMFCRYLQREYNVNNQAASGRLKGLIWVGVALAVIVTIVGFAPVISHLG